MTTTEPTLYEVLGVDSTADTAEIRVAFRKLMRLHHPDIAGPSEAAAAMTRRLTEALDTLATDPARRCAYDELIAPDPEPEGIPETPTWQPTRPAYTPPPARLPPRQRKLLLNTAWISALVSAAGLGVAIWFGLGATETVFKPIVLLLGVAGIGVTAFGPRLRWWMYLVSTLVGSLGPLSLAGVWPASGLIDSGIPEWVLWSLTIGSAAAILLRVVRGRAWAELTANR